MLGLPPTPRRASRREPCRLPPEDRREAATEYQGQLVETRHRIPEPYVAVEVTGAAEATVATVVTEATEATDAAHALVVAEATEAAEAAEAAEALTAEAIDAMKVTELREALAARELPADGKKAELVVRLREAIRVATVAPDSCAPSSVAVEARKKRARGGSDETPAPAPTRSLRARKGK